MLFAKKTNHRINMKQTFRKKFVQVQFEVVQPTSEFDEKAFQAYLQEMLELPQQPTAEPGQPFYVLSGIVINEATVGHVDIEEDSENDNLSIR